MKIIFIPHSTTPENESGITSGNSLVRLSEAGIEKAHKLAHELSEITFDVAYTSDLPRAVETIEIIMKDRDASIVKDARLREVDYGEYTGKPRNMVADIRQKYLTESFPGGESYSDVLTRVSSFLDELRNSSYQTAVICGHWVYPFEVLINKKSIEDALYEKVEKYRVFELDTKKQPILVVDIDGVLFDTPSQAVWRWNEIHDTEHETTDIYDYDAVHDKVKFRVYHDNGKYEDDKGKFDDGFYDAQKDIDNYIPMLGAKEALTRLRAKGVKIVALTSRNPRTLSNETIAAIDRYFGIGELIEEVLFAGDPDTGIHRMKGEIMNEIGGNILIDDAVRYARDAAEHGLPAILLTQPYNKSGHEWPQEKTAASWQDAERLIEQELGLD